MANTIQLTSAQLDNKKSELESLNERFKSQLADMRSTEKKVLSMWDGDASNAFDKKFDKDYAKMEKLYDAVKKYCQAIDTIIKKYEDTERKNVKIVSN